MSEPILRAWRAPIIVMAETQQQADDIVQRVIEQSTAEREALPPKLKPEFALGKLTLLE